MAKKGSINLVGSSITIDNMPIEVYINKNKQALLKASKGNTRARSLVLRYFSDFIAKESPFTDSTTSVFSRSVISADTQTSIDNFTKYLNFSPIQLNNEELNSFVSVNGLIKSKDNKSFDKLVRIDKIAKDDLIAFVKNNTNISKIIVKQITQKFSNFAVSMYSSNTQTNKVLGSLAKSLLRKSELISSENINITARVASNNSITLQYELSDVGYQTLIKKVTDITMKFHEVMGAKVSDRFMNEAMTKFVKGRSIQNTYDFIAATVGIAVEFDKKPIKYTTVIKKPKQGKISTNVTANKEKKQKSKQSFISGAQMTALVQKRLAKTMEGGGIAAPPWFTERSGRFRDSVAVFPNYRSNLIRFTYMPLYDANVKYGYDPEAQVSKSIREVVNALYTRKFNIVRV